MQSLAAILEERERESEREGGRGGERASEREREHLYVVGKVLPEEGGECTVHDRGNPQLRVCESAFSAGGRLCDAAYRNRPLSVVYLLASGLVSARFS